MRTAYHETRFLTGEDGALLGVSLGYDFCAEHEWGNGRLRSRFGVAYPGEREVERLVETGAEVPRGVESRTITRVSPGLRLIECDDLDLTILWCGYSWSNEDAETIQSHVLRDLGIYVEKIKGRRKKNAPSHRISNARTLFAAWSEDDFALGGHGAEARSNIKVLFDAFQNLDIAFGVSPKTVPWPSSAGLSFVIASRVDEAVRADTLAGDRDLEALHEAVLATGVKQAIRASGKGWYALSPRWADKAQSTLEFWLNPCEQNRYNYGWYRVDDLMAWSRNSGPIVKAAKAA